MATASCSVNLASRYGSSYLYVLSGYMSETYVSDGANNYSTISCTATLSASNISFSSSNGGILAIYWHDNRENYDRLVASGQVNQCGKTYGSKSVTGSINVYHNADGNVSGYIYVTWTPASTSTYVPYGGSTNSGWTALTYIPRYASITSFTVSKRTETSVTVNWNANTTCDAVWYSTNNGSSWTLTSGLNFVINGLTANTSYNFKIKVRRKDSQLTTTSGTYTQSTYAYPYCNSAPSFTLGNTLTLGIYNPLGREIQVYFVTATGTELGGDTITGTSISGYVTEAFQKAVYQSLGTTGTSGQYKVKVVYGNTSTSVINGGTYSTTPASCKPVLTSCSVEDVNQTTLALTNNSSQIIAGFSTARITPVYRASAEYDETSTVIFKTLDGMNFTESYIDILNTTKETFSISATNSKNYISDSESVSGELHPYIPLSITSCLFERPTPTGTRMTVNFKGSYYDGNFDTENETNPNSLTINWYVRLSESDNWTLGGTFTENTDYDITDDEYESDGTIDLTCPNSISNGTWNYKSVYYFKLEVIDELNTSLNPIVYFQNIKIGKPYFEWWRRNSTDYFNVNGKLLVEGEDVIEDIGDLNNLTTQDQTSLVSAINEVEARDYIYETGSDNNGSYVKYSDGTMMCFGNITFHVSSWNAWGSIYYYDAVINHDFPSSFYTAPQVNVNNIGGVGAMVYRVSSNATKISQISVSRPNDYQNIDLTLSYIAIGRWKQ